MHQRPNLFKCEAVGRNITYRPKRAQSMRGVFGFQPKLTAGSSVFRPILFYAEGFSGDRPGRSSIAADIGYAPMLSASKAALLLLQQSAINQEAVLLWSGIRTHIAKLTILCIFLFTILKKYCCIPL